ncbi:hypothetical protein C8Q76DRAFT_626811 [Earliella scabrosa]|nr:hypothetical protein C8Q76DRAFT_626811 [Earliella scabrosa]
MIAEDLDITDLLAWRAVCRANYHQVAGVLRRTVIATITPFFHLPCSFLRYLTKYRAVIGGASAIAFILRDRSVVSDTLEVYAASFWYASLVARMSSCPSNGKDTDKITAHSMSPAYSAERDIKAYSVFHLKNGRRVIVYRSGAVSACSPLSRAVTTAHMAFITEHSFGCAYPALTLRRRALLSDMRLSHMGLLDKESFNHLLSAGFSFAVSPSAWPQYPATAENFPAPQDDDTLPCYRARYVCPFQGRYFGDPGSLIGLIDPLGDHASSLQRRSIPPFGPMVAWRLYSSFMCASTCDVHDVTLPDNIIAISLIIIPDPFTRNGPTPRRTLPLPASSMGRRPARAQSV